jgi:hypothetical protein
MTSLIDWDGQKTITILFQIASDYAIPSIDFFVRFKQ